jgi:hypothetical protein
MTAFTFRMPAGIPGAISRESQATLEPNILDTTGAPTAYGTVVKLVAGLVRAIASGDAATVVYGFLARPYPFNDSTDGLGTSTVPTSRRLCDVMRRGYMTVALAAGTAAKGGQVFVRVTAGSGRAVGAIETAADSGNCVAIAGAQFMGPADAGGNVEIAFNI